MSFRNPCCRANMAAIRGPNTGDELTCQCGNEFLHDGKMWMHKLELGLRKIEKLRRINHVNLLAQRGR